MNNKNNLFLKVKEAKPRDSGRGIARIDPDITDLINITPGDVIIINGKKKTACLAWPGYPEGGSFGRDWYGVQYGCMRGQNRGAVRHSGMGVRFGGLQESGWRPGAPGQLSRGMQCP